MKKIVFCAFLSVLAHPLLADDVVRIEVGSGQGSSNNEELQRRVWMLERAVWQLQQRVFTLEGTKNNKPKEKPYTCSMQSMGSTFVHTAPTQAQARALLLKKCGDATNPVHCSDSSVVCGNK